MRTMRLNTKLIGAFMIMGLIILIGGLLGPIGISQLGDELRVVAEVHFPAIYNLGTIIEAQKNIQTSTQSLLIPEFFGNDAKKDRLSQEIKQAWERAENGWKNYGALSRSKEGEVIWSNLESAWVTWKKDHNEIIQYLNDGKRSEALALFVGRARDNAERAEGLLKKLSDLNLKLSEEAKKEGQDSGNWQKGMVLTGTGIGVFIAVVFGIFLAGSITKPVYRTITNLSETCDHFATTSQQIASSSHQLAGGTSNQAATVEETSSAIEELSSITQQNVNKVQILEKISSDTAVKWNETFEFFRQLKRATKEIKLSSEETSKIIKTIGEIAFQTNLLALSASVEAAQSSEFGTGFSVVAQEVRNLARRSTEAAKNTTTLIEETIKLINNGENLVMASMGSLVEYGRVSTPITSFSVKAGEVAQKQAQGLEQINLAIAEISRTAQSNASSAQESASAAQEINAQALSMINVVEKLKQVAGVTG